MARLRPKNLKKFVSYAKHMGGKLSCGSAGYRSAKRVALELLHEQRTLAKGIKDPGIQTQSCCAAHALGNGMHAHRSGS